MLARPIVGTLKHFLNFWVQNQIPFSSKDFVKGTDKEGGGEKTLHTGNYFSCSTAIRFEHTHGQHAFTRQLSAETLFSICWK